MEPSAMPSFEQVIQALDDNAELALDAIGFDAPDDRCVRHITCPFHPEKPKHQLGVWQARVSKRTACDVEELDKDALDVFMVLAGMTDHDIAATALLDSLIAEHGRQALNLQALE
jgi:hypothetical protein